MDAADRTGTAPRLRIGVAGCGDVAGRHYLPALALVSDTVEVVATCDPEPAAAARAADLVRPWSPGVRQFRGVVDMLGEVSVDGVFNITPAPIHAPVTRACLEAGVPVYSEKPIASSIREADELIALAAERGVLLLCAPAVAATRLFRWLGEIVASNRFGRLSLAVAHHADSGPATWREYTGNPEVFYGPGVGPVFDHGIYRLHGLTTLMGPVRRVQAMGAIGVPTRVVRAGPMAGRTIRVTAPDHVMINMEFETGALGQLLASFGTANTLAPWLELHFETATISFPGDRYVRNPPASIFLDDDSHLGLEGWVHGLQPPPPEEALPVVETGVVHFIRCLTGQETPILTAEHARHVLDIILKAYASIEDGLSHMTETTMAPPGMVIPGAAARS